MVFGTTFSSQNLISETNKGNLILKIDEGFYQFIKDPSNYGEINIDGSQNIKIYPGLGITDICAIDLFIANRSSNMFSNNSHNCLERDLSDIDFISYTCLSENTIYDISLDNSFVEITIEYKANKLNKLNEIKTNDISVNRNGSKLKFLNSPKIFNNALKRDDYSKYLITPELNDEYNIPGRDLSGHFNNLIYYKSSNYEGDISTSLYIDDTSAEILTPVQLLNYKLLEIQEDAIKEDPSKNVFFNTKNWGNYTHPLSGFHLGALAYNNLLYNDLSYHNNVYYNENSGNYFDEQTYRKLTIPHMANKYVKRINDISLSIVNWYSDISLENESTGSWNYNYPDMSLIYNSDFNKLEQGSSVTNKDKNLLFNIDNEWQYICNICFTDISLYSETSNDISDISYIYHEIKDNFFNIFNEDRIGKPSKLINCDDSDFSCIKTKLGLPEDSIGRDCEIKIEYCYDQENHPNPRHQRKVNYFFKGYDLSSCFGFFNSEYNSKMFGQEEILGISYDISYLYNIGGDILSEPGLMECATSLNIDLCNQIHNSDNYDLCGGKINYKKKYGYTLSNFSNKDLRLSDTTWGKVLLNRIYINGIWSFYTNNTRVECDKELEGHQSNIDTCILWKKVIDTYKEGKLVSDLKIKDVLHSSYKKYLKFMDKNFFSFNKWASIKSDDSTLQHLFKFKKASITFNMDISNISIDNIFENKAFITIKVPVTTTTRPSSTQQTNTIYNYNDNETSFEYHNIDKFINDISNILDWVSYGVPEYQKTLYLPIFNSPRLINKYISGSIVDFFRYIEFINRRGQLHSSHLDGYDTFRITSSEKNILNAFPFLILGYNYNTITKTYQINVTTENPYITERNEIANYIPKLKVYARKARQDINTKKLLDIKEFDKIPLFLYKDPFVNNHHQFEITSETIPSIYPALTCDVSSISGIDNSNRLYNKKSLEEIHLSVDFTNSTNNLNNRFLSNFKTQLNKNNELFYFAQQNKNNPQIKFKIRNSNYDDFPYYFGTDNSYSIVNGQYSTIINDLFSFNLPRFQYTPIYETINTNILSILNCNNNPDFSTNFGNKHFENLLAINNNKLPTLNEEKYTYKLFNSIDYNAILLLNSIFLPTITIAPSQSDTTDYVRISKNNELFYRLTYDNDYYNNVNSNIFHTIESKIGIEINFPAKFREVFIYLPIIKPPVITYNGKSVESAGFTIELHTDNSYNGYTIVMDQGSRFNVHRGIIYTKSGILIGERLARVWERVDWSGREEHANGHLTQGNEYMIRIAIIDSGQLKIYAYKSMNPNDFLNGTPSTAYTDLSFIIDINTITLTNFKKFVFKVNNIDMGYPWDTNNYIYDIGILYKEVPYINYRVNNYDAIDLSSYSYFTDISLINDVSKINILEAFNDICTNYYDMSLINYMNNKNSRKIDNFPLYQNISIKIDSTDYTSIITNGSNYKLDLQLWDVSNMFIDLSNKYQIDFSNINCKGSNIFSLTQDISINNDWDYIYSEKLLRSRDFNFSESDSIIDLSFSINITDLSNSNLSMTINNLLDISYNLYNSTTNSTITNKNISHRFVLNFNYLTSRDNSENLNYYLNNVKNLNIIDNTDRNLLENYNNDNLNNFNMKMFDFETLHPKNHTNIINDTNKIDICPEAFLNCDLFFENNFNLYDSSYNYYKINNTKDPNYLDMSNSRLNISELFEYKMFSSNNLIQDISKSIETFNFTPFTKNFINDISFYFSDNINYIYSNKYSPLNINFINDSIPNVNLIDNNKVVYKNTILLPKDASNLFADLNFDKINSLMNFTKTDNCDKMFKNTLSLYDNRLLKFSAFNNLNNNISLNEMFMNSSINYFPYLLINSLKNCSNTSKIEAKDIITNCNNMYLNEYFLAIRSFSEVLDFDNNLKYINTELSNVEISWNLTNNKYFGGLYLSDFYYTTYHRSIEITIDNSLQLIVSLDSEKGIYWDYYIDPTNIFNCTNNLDSNKIPTNQNYSLRLHRNGNSYEDLCLNIYRCNEQKEFYKLGYKSNSAYYSGGDLYWSIGFLLKILGFTDLSNQTHYNKPISLNSKYEQRRKFLKEKMYKHNSDQILDWYGVDDICCGQFDNTNLSSYINNDYSLNVINLFYLFPETSYCWLDLSINLSYRDIYYEDHFVNKIVKPNKTLDIYKNDPFYRYDTAYDYASKVMLSNDFFYLSWLEKYAINTLNKGLNYNDSPVFRYIYINSFAVKMLDYIHNDNILPVHISDIMINVKLNNSDQSFVLIDNSICELFNIFELSNNFIDNQAYQQMWFQDGSGIYTSLGNRNTSNMEPNTTYPDDQYLFKNIYNLPINPPGHNTINSKKFPFYHYTNEDINNVNNNTELTEEIKKGYLNAFRVSKLCTGKLRESNDNFWIKIDLGFILNKLYPHEFKSKTIPLDRINYMYFFEGYTYNNWNTNVVTGGSSYLNQGNYSIKSTNLTYILSNINYSSLLEHDINDPNNYYDMSMSILKPGYLNNSRSVSTTLSSFTTNSSNFNNRNYTSNENMFGLEHVLGEERDILSYNYKVINCNECNLFSYINGFPKDLNTQASGEYKPIFATGNGSYTLKVRETDISKNTKIGILIKGNTDFNDEIIYTEISNNIAPQNNLKHNQSNQSERIFNDYSEISNNTMRFDYVPYENREQYENREIRNYFIENYSNIGKIEY